MQRIVKIITIIISGPIGAVINLLLAALGNKKLMGVTIGALIGAYIGFKTQGFPPEVIVLIAGAVIFPVFLLEAVRRPFGEETLFLAAGALVGALVDAMSGSPTESIRGALTGVGLVAVAKPVIERFRSQTDPSPPK